MNFLRVLLLLALMCAPICLCACAPGPPAAPAPPAATAQEQGEPAPVSAPAVAQEQGAAVATAGQLVISFDYEKQSGAASNQFAVWIEDMEGRLIKTLYATRFTANGGYRNRPDSLKLWVEKSGLAAMTKDEADAISGATPKAVSLSYSWDLKDEDGQAAPPGAYKFFVEGTLRWNNSVLYSGEVTVGAEPATVQAQAEYVYADSGKNAALTAASPENSMIGPVTASFTPAE